MIREKLNSWIQFEWKNIESNRILSHTFLPSQNHKQYTRFYVLAVFCDWSDEIWIVTAIKNMIIIREKFNSWIIFDQKAIVESNNRYRLTLLISLKISPN